MMTIDKTIAADNYSHFDMRAFRGHFRIASDHFEGMCKQFETLESLYKKQKSANEKLTADRDKYRDACERLIEHYGLRPELWICQVSSCVDANCEHPDILYLSNDGHGNGHDFARQVKAEIDTNAE